MALEKDLQSQVFNFLRKSNIWFYHPRETKKGTDGLPDIICCINGAFVAIELKNPEGKVKLRPEQEEMLERIKLAGGWVLVSNNFDEIVKFINTVIRLTK